MEGWCVSEASRLVIEFARARPAVSPALAPSLNTTSRYRIGLSSMPLLKSSIPPFKAHATRNRKWAEQATDPTEKAKFLKTAEEYEIRVAEIENSLSDESDPLSADSMDSNADFYWDRVQSRTGPTGRAAERYRTTGGWASSCGWWIGKGMPIRADRYSCSRSARNKNSHRTKNGNSGSKRSFPGPSYVGDLMNEEEPVQGIIVAEDFAPSAISAARAGNVRLYKYSIKFSFERLGAAGKAMP